MKYEINKCKNHVNISDGVPTSDPSGFRTYGLIVPALSYLIHLPKLFWHQVVCPDNSALQKLSNWIYEKYKPQAYKDLLTQKRMEQIEITKKKTETLVP